MQTSVSAHDGKRRCHWATTAPEFIAYHDREWGFPVDDDHRLFEKLCLEGFQSGLSWRTILNKRENFRTAFRGFDIRALARFGARDVQRLLGDAGIVRHRGKIEAVLNNARCARDVVAKHGTLAAFFWSYEPAAGRSARQRASALAVSVQLSKDLKKQGWQFVGPTTVYAFMQAAGLINDHARACVAWETVVRARTAFERPQTAGGRARPPARLSSVRKSRSS